MVTPGSKSLSADAPIDGKADGEDIAAASGNSGAKGFRGAAAGAAPD